MRTLRAWLSPALALCLAACCWDDDDDCGCVEPPPSPRLVSILVEVYDPVTNFVWENVGVRVVEADQEWSGLTYVSPFLDGYLTDATGRVLLDEFVLGDARVGFLEDGQGRAVLNAPADQDQALVVLEVFAEGFVSVIVEVPLSWAEPDVFVEVPFN